MDAWMDWWNRKNKAIKEGVEEQDWPWQECSQLGVNKHASSGFWHDNFRDQAHDSSCSELLVFWYIKNITRPGDKMANNAVSPEPFISSLSISTSIFIKQLI